MVLKSFFSRPRERAAETKESKMKHFIVSLIPILFLTGIILACGSSKGELSFQNIPTYPASIPENHMEGSGFAGVVGGELTQLSTTDPFSTVVKFYTDELGRYNPEIMSQSSESVRQTAINIKQGNKVFTVSIQERKGERRVLITHMAVRG
jgi:hypothetical protein